MRLFGFNRLKKTGEEVGKAALKNIAETGDSKLNVIGQGVITANVLNIRSEPNTNSKVLGKFSKGAIISILEKLDDWYRFKYDNKDAFVAARFVSTMQGRINANVLNVRQEPTTNSLVLGKLGRNDIIEVAQILDSWLKIKYKNGFAYIAAQFVVLINSGSTQGTEGPKYLKDNPVLLRTAIEPSKKIAVPASPRAARLSAETYNNFGGLMDTISKQIGIETAAAIAVLAVESAGQAFGPDGRVLIRFENHLFYRFWGRQNQSVFTDHFRFDKTRFWTNHFFRKNKNDDWQTFHGNQRKEWEVFEFAQNLNKNAALLSVSYGAPQILGTNYKKIGYNSPDELLEYFSKDIRFHILGLFDFFTPQMIRHIQNKDFTSFARYYNGAGQAVRYGTYIKDFYNAFKSLKR